MNSDRAEMNDIIDHLNAWCDEEEQTAKLAAAEIATWGGSWGGFTDDIWKRTVIEADAIADQVQRHDPESAQRHVEVVRQVINDYRMSDRAILRADNPDFGEPGWRGIYAGRDAFATVLRAYAKAAGWKANEPLPHRSET